MKELSIEQKAQRYDEAIKRIENINTGKCETKFIFTEGLFEHIFPELKESEDERIRKELISFFTERAKYTEDSTFNGLSSKEIIAWLEKQGEQKSKFRVGDTIKSKYDDRQFTIKSVDLDKGAYTYTQEGCGNDIDYADEEFELVEQKPVAWSEEDAQYLLICKNALAKYQVSDKWDSRVISCWLENKLKALQKQWKPSKEQMNALDSTLQYSQVSHNSFEYLNSLYNDLKKLREE